ncbi:MAG: methylated-DNA--[protein]-cysteine S-methyltransferase [Propionibacteriales bacterium]|nr:methylated-DNA--[protein]-cysteine S-methyltransferase [Propionibacteriales bacterium]
MVTTSAVGAMRLESDGDAITKMEFVAEPVGPEGDNGESVPVLVEARRQLEEYFAGKRRIFDLPLAGVGTAFQARVWAELVKVPFGETVSYGDIARRLGMPPGASRAVGLANGANPIAIAVPCHRVIGANGKLVGYAGGLERKQFLLSLESTAADQGSFF